MQALPLIVIGVLALGAYRKRFNQKLDQVTYQITDVKFDTFQGLNAKIYLRISNPFTYALTVKDYSLSLWLNNSQIAKGVNFVNQTLKARSFTTLVFTFKISGVNSATFLYNLFTAPKVPVFTLKGFLNTDKGSIPVNYNYDYYAN